MKKLQLFKTMLLLCALIVGSGTMWGANKVLTFSLTSNPGGWPTTNSTTLTNYTYTLDEVSYTFALKNVKCNSGYLMLTSTAVLGLPAISGYKLTKVVASNSGGCSTSTTVGISSSSTSASYITGGAIQTWSKTSSSYTYNLTSTSGNTMYYLYVTTKNAQVTQLELTYEDLAPAQPTFDPVAGDFSSDFTLHLASATDGATIYYTTDGSTPTSSSTEYNSSTGISISAGANVTVKAIAIKGGISSTVASATYTFKDIANPLFDPADGSTVLYGNSVSLSCATDGAEIYYTQGQGSTPADPTSTSTHYSTPIVLTAGTTIKAIAINGDDKSEVVSATYTVKATAPTFSVAEGTFDTTQSVELSCTTEGATIYYTTNGSTPTNESTEYTGAITVSSSKTIKAIAIKTGLTNSDVASATYTLKCATPSFSVAEGIYTATQSVELSCATDGATIYYTTNGNKPSSSSTEYTGAITVSSSQTIKAIAIKSGLTDSEIATATYRIVVPATLPFAWEGGGKAALQAVQGVETSSLSNDYSDSHSPYEVKFDDDGKYIQVRTNGPIGTVSVKVKMIGGSSTSKIKVKGSTNGTDFADVEELTISGSQNDIVELETSEVFNTAYNWVRLEFVKGSNVGVGPIEITKKVAPVTITTAEYATYCNADNALDFTGTGITAYTATDNTTTVKLNEITSGQVPANTPVVLHKAGADGKAINVPVIISAASVGDNDLKVVGSGGISGKDNMYVLAKKNDIVGFYLWDNTKTLNEGKIYLDASGAGSRDFLGFLLDDETTGVKEVKVVNDNNYFDLLGRKVKQPGKGLYIINGRKVVIK